MVKDRLAEFQARRIEFEMEDSRKKKGKKDKKDTEEMSLPALQEQVIQVQAKMDELKKRVGEIEKLQKNLYCKPNVTAEELREMENLADRILSLSITLRKDIEVLSNSNSPSGESKALLLSNAEQRVHSMQVDRLQNSLKQTMDSFRTSQANYLEKTKLRLNRTREIAGIDSNGGTGNAQSVFAGGYSIQEMIQAKTDLQEIQEREKELTDLEKQIVEVNQLFKEMHGLVQDQGEKVDNIEKYIDSAVADVEAGKEDLKAAEENQRKARRKKCICYSIIIVLILIVVGVIVGVIIQQSSGD